jgi:hypothetical protein
VRDGRPRPYTRATLASITIRDSLKVDLITADPQPRTGLGKYLPDGVAQLVAEAIGAGQLRGLLTAAHAGESGLNLSWSDTVPIGPAGDKIALSISAGTKAVVGVYNRTGMELFESSFTGASMKVPAGRAFVAFSIRPTLGLEAKQQQVGALTFGFSAGSETELRCYRPFDLTIAPPITLAAACKDLLEHFVIPNTAADLRQMSELPAGSIACASGHGQLTIAASVNLAAAFNPLASVGTIPVLGTLSAGGGGASASVGISATVSGEFQIRAQRLDGSVVRLGFHTVAGRGLDVTVGASAATGLTLGDKDLLKLLFAGPGGVADAAKEDLVKDGLTSEQLDRVTATMKAGLSRRLELAVSAAFSALESHEAAFLYEIDLDALDAGGAAAIDRALAGDLTALNAIEADGSRHGIRTVQSRTQALSRKTVSWRINLVGIVNVLSMRELVRSGSVAHDTDSGELVIVDKVTSDRVGATVEPKQIRRLLYESALMTLTYKAGGLDVNTGLDAAQSFFFFDKAANRQRISDYLDAVAAVGLLDAAATGEHLAGDDDFGKASLLLETTFGQAACERVFGVPGPPPDRDFYEGIGRRALAALVKPSDPDAYRRLPMIDEALWRRMRDGGQAQFRTILPPPITGGAENQQALRVGVVAADYSVIVWWAKAMALAASRLADMRAFLEGRTATSLDQDAAFGRRRADLSDAIVKAIRENTSTFDDPWGLVALFMASAGKAAVAATLVSPKLTLFLPE